MRRLAILLATLLAAGCLGAADEPAPAALDDVRTDAATLRAIEEEFSGTALGTPAQPGAYEFTLDVPTGAVGVNGTLSWSDPAARFRLELVDPNGDVAATGYPEQDGRLVAATVEPPRSGTWTYRVTAPVAVNVPFTLRAVAELLVPQDNVVRQTTTLNPSGYNEVNVVMEANATFSFAFNASDDVEWNVHSHPGNEVKYWQEGVGTTAAGSFTAPERGIYSLLFHNAGALPVDLSFQMAGAFRLHSHAQ